MKRVCPSEDESLEPLPFSRIVSNSIRATISTQNFSEPIPHITHIRDQLDLSKVNSDVHNDLVNLSPTQRKSRKGVTYSIRNLFKKASESIKSRRRNIHEHKERSRITWGRIRSHSALSRLGFESDNEFLHSPVPGSGNRPPKIPHGLSGSAARAAAAAENRAIPSLLHNEFIVRNRQLFRTNEQQEDGESGIGIAVTATPVYPNNKLDSSMVFSEISRVDFISNLPSELAIQILTHLDQTTLRNIATVSKQWLKISLTQCVWREVFLREQTKTYASSKPVLLGAGLGLPSFSSNNDWKDLYRIREQLRKNWMHGTAEAIYLNGHLDSIYCIQFDEKKIITGSRDKTIRIWDLKKYICTLIIGPPDVVNNPLLIVGEDGRPRHYAIMPDMTKNPAESHPEMLSYPIHHNQSILCLQYDSKILVTGSSDGTCIIHDIENRYRPIRQLRHHTAAVLDLAFDERHIVTCSKDITICIWDRNTGTLIKQLRGHAGPVNAVQLRGNTIVSCSGDFRVKLWNIDTGKNIKELMGHTKGLACSQFSEDSRFIASAGNDKTIRIWDANTGEALKSIAAHDNLVRSLHIDSISGRLVSGSYDQDIKVFDMSTGAMLLDFPKWHSSWVLGAKSDYRRIISTGQDPKILIMDFGMKIKGIENLES
ncbi:Beta-TrCP [Erysiphe necator]|nr:Beta-TrCP [Erysiphe necator]